ncbi:hypothetical protein WN50_39075 [Limnoraphis robusta CS-951]|nr:hypothetical protein WN50_39075 [Limnoraphis robusta CS-951]
MIQKNYPIISLKGDFKVSQNQLYADVYQKYSRLYLKQKKIFKSLKYSKKLADYTSLNYAFSNIKNEFKEILFNRFSRLHSKIRPILSIK